MQTKIVWSKIVFAIVVLLGSAAVAYLYQPKISGNKDALDTLVNIYSILAGFLVGIIALIGDPLSIPIGSWRVAQAASRNTFRHLRGTKILLTAYLITLLLIFLYRFLSPTGDVQLWIERFILFVSITAFAYSLLLPSKLFNIQEQRVKHLIDERRKAAGINDEKMTHMK